MLEYQAAFKWGFNCGPGALGAILGVTPEQMRPWLGDFERKGYMNPTMMQGALQLARRPFEQIYRGDVPVADWTDCDWGLVRVQWSGRWTNPGVPMRARYRQTHWVGVAEGRVWDVNAPWGANRQWLPFCIWQEDLVPEILEECVPGADGVFWPTHVWRVGK